MAIQYVCMPEKKKTVAILQDTRFDAINKIAKVTRAHNIFFNNYEKYLLNNSYRGVVVCCEEDTYSQETGKKQAKKKCLDRYNAALDAKIAEFRNDVTKMENDINKNLYFK